MANKIYKLDSKAFAQRAKKMRNVIFLLMLVAFSGTMIVLNALPGDDLPFLTILMVSIFLGLVFYFVFYRMNARMNKIFEGFALEIGKDAISLRQFGHDPLHFKRAQIEGIGTDAQGGQAIVLKGEEGSIPLPVDLADREKAIKDLERFLAEGKS